jgi:uncharacterized RDD family membrane protein YckC
MKPEDVYVQQVLSHILPGPVRDQVEAEVRSHIADRVDSGSGVEDAIRQLGDPRALAESYLAAVPMRKAPHIRRGLAKLVDLALVWLLPCVVFVTWWITAAHEESPVWLVFASAFVLSLAFSCWVPIVMEYRSGQSFGKRLFGLQVVTEKGGRIGLGQSLIRHIPVFLQVFTIDALFALVTDRRQRAFEMLTKTRVIDVSEPPRHTRAVAAAIV